ncbi:MAG: hypothetical protein ABID38_01340 [Candidatus Diapherotrites archaeon]
MRKKSKSPKKTHFNKPKVDLTRIAHNGTLWSKAINELNNAVKIKQITPKVAEETAVLVYHALSTRSRKNSITISLKNPGNSVLGVKVFAQKGRKPELVTVIAKANTIMPFPKKDNKS